MSEDKEVWLSSTELERLLQGDLHWEDVQQRNLRRQQEAQQILDRRQSRIQARPESLHLDRDKLKSRGLKLRHKDLKPSHLQKEMELSGEVDLNLPEEMETAEVRRLFNQPVVGVPNRVINAMWLLMIVAGVTLGSWIYYVFII